MYPFEEVFINTYNKKLLFDLYLLYTSCDYFKKSIDFQKNEIQNKLDDKLKTLNFTENQLEFIYKNMKYNINYNIDLSQFNDFTIINYIKFIEEKYNEIEFNNLLEYYESIVFANYILNNDYSVYLLKYIENTVTNIINSYIKKNSNDIKNTYLDVCLSSIIYISETNIFETDYKEVILNYNELYDNYMDNYYNIISETTIKKSFIQQIFKCLCENIKCENIKCKNITNIYKNYKLHDFITVIKLDYIINSSYNIIINILCLNFSKNTELGLTFIKDCIEYIKLYQDLLIDKFLIKLYEELLIKKIIVNTKSIIFIEINNLCESNDNKLNIKRLKFLNTYETNININNINNNNNIYYNNYNNYNNFQMY